MDKQRAKEISSSKNMINVTYNGTPIYIESVDEIANTASIHFLNSPKKSRDVSLSNLLEH